MKLSRKKWILMGVFLAVIGSGALFLFRVTSRSAAPSTARSTVVPENPDHELKELAVQLQRKPGHTPVLMRMAQIERDKGQLEDAAGHLRQVIGNEPANADAYLELGRVLYEKGDVNGAIAQTSKAVEVNPRAVDALYNLGAIYANLGNPERARSYWTRAVAADAASDSGKKARDGLNQLARR